MFRALPILDATMGCPLVYTAAFGNAIYYQMAQECVTSARRHGYTGDFFVLTGRPHAFEVAHCKVVASGPEVLSKAALVRVLGREELAQREKILFIDADCVFTVSPDSLLALEGLRLPIVGALTKHCYNAIFLTDPEKREARRRKTAEFNSGTILIPGAQAFDFLKDWEEAWRGVPRDKVWRDPQWAHYSVLTMDQPALQALLFRANIPWSNFPKDTVAFPVYTKSREGAILHFCGPLNAGMNSHLQNKQVVLGWMKAANAAFTAPRPSAKP